jgi:hypothetical protein
MSESPNWIGVTAGISDRDTAPEERLESRTRSI